MTPKIKTRLAKIKHDWEMGSLETKDTTWLIDQLEQALEREAKLKEALDSIKEDCSCWAYYPHICPACDSAQSSAQGE